MSGSPTLKLHNLTAASTRMLNSLINLPTNPEVETAKKTIGELRQRTYIMSQLYDRCIVAVAGLQGVGKSTLMSNLYEFDDKNSPFLGNQGQGETLPILITECENPGQLFVHKIENIDGISTFVRREITDAKQFREKAHKYNKSEDILLEVTVPFKVFNCSDRSFLLLPGFQKESGHLKDLTYTALRTSMNCLILFYNNKYAHRDNKELIDALNSEFKEASPIFTLTWSDNEADNVELAEKVKRDLNISEEDRVIRTGSPGPQGWKDQLTEVVRKYSIPSTGVTEVQNKNMEELIDDYYAFAAQVQSSLYKMDTGIENAEYRQVERNVKLFRREAEEIKSTLKTKLEEVFNPYFHKIQTDVDNKLKERYGDWIWSKQGFFDLFRNNIVVRKELKDLVENCSKSANKNSVQEELLIVYNRVANHYWSQYAVIMNLPTERDTKYDKMTLLTGGDGKRDLPVSEESLKDIAAILNPDSKVEFSKDLESSIKLLPLLALESYRINSIIGHDLTVNEFHSRAFQDDSLIRHYQENKKEVAIGVGVLFGLDIVQGDGIDLFGLIQHNAANGGTAMAAASFHWALAALAVGGALVYMLDQMSKSVDKNANELYYHIEKMKDYTIEKVLTNYDSGMKRFEDILRGCLARKHGIQEGFANIQNCELSLKDLQDTSREIEKIVKSGKWVN